MFRHTPPQETGKKFTKPSMTQPEEALSMRQILERYAKGLPLGGHEPSSAFYDEESNGINVKTLDLSELEEIQSLNQETFEKAKALRKKTQQKAFQKVVDTISGEEAEQQ